jgi:hypothetical protein
MSTPEEYQSKGKKPTIFSIIETVSLPKESMKLEPIDIQENAKKTMNLNKKSHIKIRAVKKSQIKTRSMKKSQMKTQSDFRLLLLVQGKAVPRVRWNLIANQSEAENQCN